MGIGARAAAASGPRRLGRYELIAKIAAGGMAEVFLARQHGPMGFHKVVVVKTIHEHLAQQQDFIDMFLDEARVSALIKHHNVVDIYDLGVEDGTYFIAMEYISGQALSKVMSFCHRTGERLDVMLAIDLIAAAAHGLEAAHNLKGITGKPLELVHRDVSPGNILVSYNGAVKLVDFGVSKSLGSISSSQSSVLKGKIGYASPEQLEDAQIDRRSDVFSLGVVLWELLVFDRLFRAGSAAATVKKILDGDPPPPSSRRPEVPPELDKVCLKALARDRDERYQTAGEMRAALLGILQAQNHHSDQEELATFMSDSFARERAEEARLIRQVADSSVEIELFETSGPSAASTTEELEVDAELITLHLEEDDDDEVEISIEPVASPAVVQAADSIPLPVSRARTLRLAGAITGGVLLLALIAALLAGEGPKEPAAQAAETEPTSAREVTPEPQPATAKPEKPPAPRPEKKKESAAVVDQVDAAPTGESSATREPEVDPAAEAARLTGLADKAMRAGRTRTAKALYKQALEHQEHPRAFRGLALLYANAGRSKSARYYLNRYLRAAPNAPDAEKLRRRVYNSIR